jgi:Uma2 family endonuclease
MVEVAETSEDDDRQNKVPLYARRGIDEVWLGDLRQRRLIVYRDLAAESYRTAQSFQSSEAVSSSAFPDKLCVVARVRARAPTMNLIRLHDELFADATRVTSGTN